MTDDPDVSGRIERPLDLWRLQQFVTTARAPSITAAAGELFISQQALSAALRGLERDLGVDLFDRGRRGTRLTPAGRELLASAPALLSAVRTAARSTRQAAVEPRPPFVVGHTPAIPSSEVFDLVRPLLVEDADLAITVRAVFPTAIGSALFDGEIDLALRRGITTPADLATSIVAYHPLRVAVAATHPLADRSSVSTTELAPHPLIVWAPQHHSAYTDYLVAHCRRSGFEPELITNRMQGTAPLTAPLVYPEGYAFVTDDPGPAHHRTVRILDLDDPPMAPVQAVWAPHTVHPVRTRLLEIHPPPNPGASSSTPPPTPTAG
ncbi:LysR family transcriptional regulator [Gordonia soli]|uniref:Putative transcriptional regulator n=1 Tax=Gordonia soli NBRC 108243 TaxID=1223545 RepID=M0QP28_9ACTN|nr:LysR family transcriptional regulator [Gordonia soli]GAC70164.1 putative transcriptional regulator [Gordonia soli NBRC 108243]